MSTTQPHNEYPAVPSEFAELMRAVGWKRCNYDQHLASHRDDDLRYGVTCYYSMRRDPDISKIETLLGSEFAKDGDVNQHAMHSLRLAVWEAQKAFAEHQSRLEKLSMGPQGRTVMTHKDLIP